MTNENNSKTESEDFDENQYEKCEFSKMDSERKIKCPLLEKLIECANYAFEKGDTAQHKELAEEYDKTHLNCIKKYCKSCETYQELTNL